MTQAFATPSLVSGSWLLGSLGEFRDDPLTLLERVARDHGDLAAMRLGLFKTLMVSSPRIVQEVLVEHADAFVKSPALSVFARPLLGEGLLTSEREVHRRQRKLLAPAFGKERLTSYAETMVERGVQSIERMLHEESADLCAESMRVTLEIVASTLFGAEIGDAADEVGDALTEAMESIIDAFTSIVPLPPLVPTRSNRRLWRAVRGLDRVVYRMIAARRGREAEHDDMLSMLLAARDEHDATGMSDRQVRDEAMTLFLAGHETTANVLAWSIYLLARHPEVRARVEAEVDAQLEGRLPTVQDLPSLQFTLQVIKETMRLYPPAHVMSRRAARAITIAGHPVRKNQVVIINVYGMHRRADLYERPLRFEPDRFSKEREALLPRHAYMPFGAGARVCIGNRFALMEAQLVLATWVQRARVELLEPTRPVTCEPLITLRPNGPLRVRIQRRFPPAAEGRLPPSA